MTVRLVSLFAAVLVLLVAAYGVSAQGTNVMQHGACAASMVSAAVTDPCRDGSAILFNPAAIALHPSVATVGASVIRSQITFTYDEAGMPGVTNGPWTTTIPSGFATYRIGDRTAVGLGVFLPYGLGLDWPLDFEGRFAAYKSDFRNLYVQPTIARALTPWLSVGGGVDLVSSELTLRQRLDFAEVPVPGQPFTMEALGIPRGTDFADVMLTGSDRSWTFNLGALVTLRDGFTLGVRYLHSADLALSGDAVFEQVETSIVLPAGHPLNPTGNPLPLDFVTGAPFGPGGPFNDQKISTSLKVPAQLAIGMGVRATPSLRLAADYQRTWWGDWTVAEIDFGGTAPTANLILDYQDTNTYLLAAEHLTTDALRFRVGFRYNTAAQRDASVSPLLPEGARSYYSAGVGIDLIQGATLDLSYQLVDQGDRAGRVRARQSLEQTAADLNVGTYAFQASVFGASLSWRLGGAGAR